uniref:Uncharacterized protein n=1 Tax=Branchiostoma floridae TaxID=7739 RepID=C3XUI4_BRAFL|eukprot:XP_002612549.1 hypothetical protein BRAFLDRAFT_75328 [Branchiostoma floridae]
MSGTLRRPKSLQALNLPSPTGKKGLVGTSSSTTTITITKDNALGGQKGEKDRKSLPDRLLSKTDSQSEDLSLAHVTELIPETVESTESAPAVKKTSTSPARVTSRRTDSRQRALNFS